MSQRPSRVSDIQQAEDIDRLLRRTRREAQVAQAQAQEAARVANEAELAVLAAEAKEEEHPVEELEPLPPIMANLPALLNLAATNPFTNLSDLTTENGHRLWCQATEPLKEPFDGSHQNFQNFSAAITNRFKMCNWLRFITFNVEGASRELITHPGMISLTQVQEAYTSRTIILDNPPDPTDQTTTVEQIEAYNSAVITHVQSNMMYHFLANSITTPLQTHISQKIMSGLVYEDGPLLLKYIQEKVKGRANKQAVLNAHSALLNLNLKEFKFNVKKLHDHVNTQVLTITSNGGQVMGEGITAALLTTYKTSSNDEFLHAIRHTEAVAADEDKDINYQELMVKAETVYDTLVQKKKWGKKDPRDEQILALQAQVNALSKKKKSNKTNNGSNSSSNNNDSQKRRRYPEWRYDKPKNNKTHIKKEINGKQVDFWWCEVLQMWARHKPEECKAKNNVNLTKQPSTNNKSGNHQKNTNSEPPRLQVAQATTYVMSDEESES